MMLGAFLRLWDLGRPHAVVFDETYYLKDALALLRFGTEQEAIPDADSVILGSDGNWRTLDVFTGEPSFVVHPPIGKWLIGIGEFSLGVTPVGWRIAVALASVLSILMLGRIVRRLTGSDLVGGIAALLLALDGLHLVMGRTALLDGLLMFFVLAAFGALLIDRDRMAGRYLLRAPAVSWWRPWRITAGVLLGLACAVKWSGLWYLAAFGLLTVFWEISNRRKAGVVQPWRSTLRQDAAPAFGSLVVVAAVVYVLSWTGWLVTDSGWGRNWAAGQPASLMPDSLRALWAYHQQMYNFHVGLDSDHNYRASAWGWLLQVRPTSFFYESDGVWCGGDKCAAAVTSLGNPLIWWAGVLALVHQSYRAVFVRDWRSAAVVVGVLAGWAPWLLYADRTIFTFYSVVFVPFLVAALAMSLGTILGTDRSSNRQWRIALVGGYLIAVVIAAWWFYPVWTGQPIPYYAWRLRMWLPSWI